MPEDRVGRGGRPGEKHPYSKGTDAQRMEVFRRFMLGERAAELADVFPWGPDNIRTIVYAYQKKYPELTEELKNERKRLREAKLSQRVV